MLRICHSIKKTELTPLKNTFSLNAIIKGAKKVQKGLGIPLGQQTFPRSKLVKLALTSSQGSGRIVYLFIIQENSESFIYPVVLRKKQDKKIGNNMSFANQDFTELLDTNLERIFKDLTYGAFEEIDISD